MELARELRDRDIGVRELADAASVTPATVSRIARGLSRGYPKTRRALRAALERFPVLETAEPPAARASPPRGGPATREMTNRSSTVIEGRGDLVVIRNPNRPSPPGDAS